MSMLIELFLQMGEKITKLDPARGFSAQFGGAFTVLFASWMGLPISTTHTLVGSITGVGLVEGVKNVNLNIIRSIQTLSFLSLHSFQ
jgi:inorganic phosphate transporter, PiT family